MANVNMMASKRSADGSDPLDVAPLKKIRTESSVTFAPIESSSDVSPAVDVFEDDETIEISESGKKIKAVKSFLDCHIDLYGPFSYDMGDLHDYIVELPHDSVSGVEEYKDDENADPLDVDAVRDAFIRRKREKEEAISKKKKQDLDQQGNCKQCAMLAKQRKSLGDELLTATFEVNRLQEMVDSLEGKLSSLTGKHKELDHEASEMRTELASSRIENAKLRGENSRLERSLEKAVFDAERYSSQNEVLRKTAEETSSTAALETKTLSEQLSKAQNEAKRLSIELQAAQRENGTLRSERLKALSSLDEIRQGEKKLEEEYGSYGDRIKELSQENKQLEEGFSSAKKKYQAAKHEADKWKKDYDKARSSRSVLEEEISALLKSKTFLEDEVSALKKGKVTAETNHNILLKSHHAMKKDLDEVTVHLQDMCAKNADLIRALEESSGWKKRAKTLQTKLENLERDVAASSKVKSESSEDSDSSSSASDERRKTEDLEDILKRLTKN